MQFKDIVSEIESSIKFLADYEKDKQHVDFGDWESRFQTQTNKLVNKDLSIKTDKLLNFRGEQIFVTDKPKAAIKNFYSNSPLYYGLKRIFNVFIGQGRGGVKEALDSYKIIEKMGFLDLLKKYPSPDIGRPFHVHYKGHVFTNRYIRHIYLVSLLKKILASKLKYDSNFLDIGCSYGIFSSIIKQEMPKTHHVLVDMPGQLMLAHYYFAMIFPEAKIASFKDVGQAKQIDASFVKQFDFVLVPTSMYNKLTRYAADIVTSFRSLSEMSRPWFDTYVQSDVFKTAQFFYTLNRYDANPTYKNDITILDYPLHEYKKLYMRTCPFLKYYYTGVMLFGCKRVNYSSHFFQFIGERKDLIK